MAGFQINRQGFATAGALMISVIEDMLANGFTFVGPGVEYARPTGTNAEKFAFTLEAGPNVDPLNATALAVKQPWRVNLAAYNNATAGMVVGSDDALPNDGSLPGYLGEVISVRGSSGDTTTTELMGVYGLIGDAYTPLRKAETNYGTPGLFFDDFTVFKPHFLNKDEGIINRCQRVWKDVTISAPYSGSYRPAETWPTQPSSADSDLSNAHPLSYFLSITNRGFFLAIWEGVLSDVVGNYHSWVLVQRPVDRDTGETIVTGKAPVFCVNSVDSVIRRFVVRESDVLRASPAISAVEDSVDCAAIMNDKVQVAVSEDNQYVVSFPSRLNTLRFAYTYELDMIGYTSATVVSHNAEIPLTLYEEATPRTYIALHSNMENSNGMRIVALKLGGGIDA